MKKYSVLIAMFLFSCTSEIESPYTILQRLSNASTTSSSSGVAGGEAYQVLANGDFAGGVLDPWEVQALANGYINLRLDDGYYRAMFHPSGKEENDWDIQLSQSNLNIKPGYSYQLKFGGGSINSGTSANSIVFVLMHCDEETWICTDYKKWMRTLPYGYQMYNKEDIWKNCPDDDYPKAVTDSEARFVISGGNSKVAFKISDIQISAEPINCP